MYFIFSRRLMVDVRYMSSIVVTEICLCNRRSKKKKTGQKNSHGYLLILNRME